MWYIKWKFCSVCLQSRCQKTYHSQMVKRSAQLTATGVTLLQVGFKNNHGLLFKNGLLLVNGLLGLCCYNIAVNCVMQYIVTSLIQNKAAELNYTLGVSDNWKNPNINRVFTELNTPWLHFSNQFYKGWIYTPHKLNIHFKSTFYIVQQNHLMSLAQR